MARLNYIEFYYSTKRTPVDKYKCNNENVLRLLKSLESREIETAAIDLADNPDPGVQYHKASSGPAFEYRPIFSEVQRGDYKEYFGKTIPALCCYTKKGDRMPVEVFPRMDNKLGRVYLIEEWLEDYIDFLVGKERAGVPSPKWRLKIESKKGSMKKPSPKLKQMQIEWHWKNDVLSRAKEVQGRAQTPNGVKQALDQEQAEKERAALKKKDLH